MRAKTAKYSLVRTFFSIQTDTCSYQPGGHEEPTKEVLQPPTIVNWQDTRTIYVGQPLKLSCHVSGYQNPYFFWQHHSGTDETFVGILKTTLYLPKTKWEDVGHYKCIAVNVAGVDFRTVNVTS